MTRRRGRGGGVKGLGWVGKIISPWNIDAGGGGTYGIPRSLGIKGKCLPTTYGFFFLFSFLLLFYSCPILLVTIIFLYLNIFQIGGWGVGHGLGGW